MLRKVLTCKPNHFQVEYQINPWMKPGSVDQELAMEQWQNLIRVYSENGIEVEMLEQSENQPDMVFAADQGLIINKSGYGEKLVVMSNFKHTERRGETEKYTKWFNENGYKVEFLPQDMHFEGGGELIPWNGKYFIGSGLRNSHKTHIYLEQKYNLEFISLKLIDPKFYHLDTCFFVLNTDTAFYYPKAFDEDSKKILQNSFKNLIEFTDSEIEGFAANSVVSGDLVFMQKNNTTFKQKIESFSYQTIEVDISEFIKSGGGIHCLTFELEREPHFNLYLKKPENQFQIKAN
jgi:N-dimethylarginine dimethylaminohydrolase